MAKIYDIFTGMLAGVVIGATAVFLSDEKNRKKVQSTVDDWKQKGGDEIEKLQNKAEELREKGLETVSNELSKTQARIDKSRK